MYELKTKVSDIQPSQVIEAIEHPGRREDARELIRIFESASGYPARVWGEKQIGFGEYHYRYASGHEGSFYQTGFAVAKANITLYLSASEAPFAEMLSRLGKTRSGKSCVYIKRLSDIDRQVLREMIKKTVELVKAEYP